MGIILIGARKMLDWCKPNVMRCWNSRTSVQKNLQNFIIIFMRGKNQWRYVRCVFTCVNVNLLPTLKYGMTQIFSE